MILKDTKKKRFKRFFRRFLFVLVFVSYLVNSYYFLESREEANYYEELYLDTVRNLNAVVLSYDDLFDDYNRLVEDYNFLLLNATYTNYSNPFMRSNYSIKKNKVILFFNKSFFKAGFKPTGSMRPLLGENTTCFFQDINYSSLRVGDVITYQLFNNSPVAHRVVELGEDEEGWFAITKGDNNLYADNFRIRARHVTGVLVACFY